MVPPTMIDWPRESDVVQPKTVFMIMPRYPFTLSQIVRFRQQQGQKGILLSENEIIHLSTQLCEVLSHIHQHKIVHRDVKLDNILIDIHYITLLPSLLANDSYFTLLIISYVGLQFESNVVLGDFGEALDCRDTRSKDFRLRYDHSFSKGGAQIALSPEILEAKSGPSIMLDYSMNDIYALGRVIWDMMYYPLEPPSPLGPPNGQPTFSMYYSKRLREMVLSLLSVDPKDRLTFNDTIIKKIEES
jgi:serine/threonine protein kinase